ncbi:DNA end-binding protein Ku [Streptosporangium becharense]|uniref:Non-homologous end joining protein Ku n=1 Tax=Streptosporangium becharense TaxID=1816182 RepID=A0A7W9II71_9ACTN|nr:Ku protein [Streptosporangium becharense]MBB2913534.1 DNA end-binding protein Ku [Streptosporangium becharense]MBB5821224.1 DNA end-binding protein Ku [Streptosporangium becharense]
MRSIWRGAVSFGMVTIPVGLHPATEQRNVTFHLVHRDDGGRVRFRRVCEVCEEVIPYSEVAKGYELPSGDLVVLTADDFDDLPLSTSRRIEVLQFSPADQIDPILFAKSYYLEPEEEGAKPYVLLRDALERSGRVAIVKVALRQRESLAALRVREGVLVLETMLWPDEVRAAEFPFLYEAVDVRDQETRMAVSLIESMTADFDPARYEDSYREALHEVIEAKVAGRQTVHPQAPVERGPEADLMAALRASVEAAKRSGGSPAGGEAAGRPGGKDVRGGEKAPRGRRGRRSA